MPLRYAFVALLMAVALVARLAIAPLDGGIQYVTFFPAVAIAAVVGGFGPGMFAAAIGLVLATYLFWPPYVDFGFSSHMAVSNAVFLFDALLVCSAIEAMHRYYGRYVAMERELRLAASVFQNSSEGIMVTDRRGHIVSVNPAFSEITGYTAAEAVGKTPRLLSSGLHGETFYTAMWEALRRDGCWQGEVLNRHKDGEIYPEWLTINRIDGGGEASNYVAVFHDLTELRKKDEHVRHLAYHDGLTGLPNRLLFQDRLQHAIERARRDATRLLVAFIDLDHFKEVNDRLGHEVGDLLLQEVARRIQENMREADTVARLGGDEFVLLLENMDEAGNCIRVMEKLIDEISRPMMLDGHRLEVGASIGLAFFPDHGSELSELVKCADLAMYRAKSAGRNGCRMFEQDMAL